MQIVAEVSQLRGATFLGSICCAIALEVGLRAKSLRRITILMGLVVCVLVAELVYWRKYALWFDSIPHLPEIEFEILGHSKYSMFTRETGVDLLMTAFSILVLRLLVWRRRNILGAGR